MPGAHRECQRRRRSSYAINSSLRVCLVVYLYQFFHREETGAIYLSAWREDLWVDLDAPYFDYHERIFEKLGVSHDRGDDCVTCRFTEAQARAFMLLHIFMHELGHHYDRSNQKHFGSSKGEDYAERFANSRFDQLFPAYVRVFGHPAGPGQTEP